MSFIILADERFTDDLSTGRTEPDASDSRRSWDFPPRYLLGKILTSPHWLPVRDLTQVFRPEQFRSYIKTSGNTIVLPHVDMTIRPPEFEDAAKESGVRFLNGKLRDLRKSTLQTLLTHCGLPALTLHTGVNPHSEVFVKSNFNAGDATNRTYRKMRYNEVPQEVWSDPDVVVQPFVEDHLALPHGYARMRRFLVVGQEIVQLEYFSRQHPIKRRTSAWQYSRDVSFLHQDLELFCTQDISQLGYSFRCLEDELGNMLADLLRFIASIELDFGAIDTISTDRLYVLDVNPTPWERGTPPAIVKILSRGLFELVGFTL